MFRFSNYSLNIRPLGRWHLCDEAYKYLIAHASMVPHYFVKRNSIQKAMPFLIIWSPIEAHSAPVFSRT